MCVRERERERERGKREREKVIENTFISSLCFSITEGGSSRGRNSAYTMFCHIPIKIFLASWYKRSSFQPGFTLDKPLAMVVWALWKTLCIPERPGCSLVLASPVVQNDEQTDEIHSELLGHFYIIITPSYHGIDRICTKKMGYGICMFDVDKKHSRYYLSKINDVRNN